MAYYFKDVSHTFNEYLLVPGYSSSECIPANVSLKTPLVNSKRVKNLQSLLTFPWYPLSCNQYRVSVWLLH